MITLASMSTKQAQEIADRLQTIIVDNLSYHTESGDINLIVRTTMHRLIDFIDIEDTIEDVLNDRD